MVRRLQSLAVILPVLLLCTGASWKDQEDATGSWSGLRSKLESEYGIHIDLDYTAESFGSEDLFYLGCVDLALTIDTSRAGLWSNGTFFFFGQNVHGKGVSAELGFLMPASNLESESFTQVSEFWLHQQLGNRLWLRLGKQDANRDFGNPRFGGNFINSSYGVMPGIPMPSFPTPGLGAVALFKATESIEFRTGLYEGTPQIGSFGESAFAEDAGIFAISSMVYHHGDHRYQSGSHQMGIWKHSALDRWGFFAVYDQLFFINPRSSDDLRSIQIFTRGGWSPREETNAPDEITTYIGGGITAHAFLGSDNTLGLGAGWSDTREGEETFIELFFKIREISWLTIEPDVQFYFKPEYQHFVFGLRTKIKL